MNMAVYSKLDLPTHHEDEVAWTHEEIESGARSGRPDFVRRTCLEYAGPEYDLSTVLKLADLVLDQVCETMEVEKIKYSWGLAAMSEANRKRLGATDHNNAHELLPAGYGLVARVENVIDARPITHFSYWDDRIHAWNPAGIGLMINDNRIITNSDLRADQFVLRPNPDQEGHDTAVLVDIEPRLNTSTV
jgi:hypothetical protein